VIARVTVAEIDAVRWSMKSAVELFRESVLPSLHEQDGYEGGYALMTPEGKALVITFWRDQESADASVAAGHYEEQVAKFGTIYRAPPGRETYEVAVAEAPTPAVH
jgi:heme-degrading monooxygenase HmoA